MNANTALQVTLLSCLMIGCMSWAFAVEQTTSQAAVNGLEILQTPTLKKLFPHDCDAIEHAARDGKQMEAVKSCLAVVERIQQRMVSPSAGPRSAEEGQAFQEAWALACHLAKQGNDVEARQIFQRKWDSLLSDTRTVTLQLGSLDSLCPVQLTLAFWKSAQNAKDVPTLSAYAYAIYNHGDADDLQRAQNWLSTFNDPEKQQILLNAIDWLRHRLSGNDSSRGPAARPPVRPTP